MAFLAKINESVNDFIGRITARLGMGVRGKLITVFILVKVIPLILLALLAWYQIIQLGVVLREQAVKDSTEALNHNAIENIERMTTTIAEEVAEFLYGRDSDISVLATMSASDGDSNDSRDLDALEERYHTFLGNKTGRLVEAGEWGLTDDGMSWVRLDSSTAAESGNVSTNPENDDEVNGASFHYRPPDVKQSRLAPYYEEITFLSPDLQELVKVVSDDSAQWAYPLSPELKDVSKKENTYLGAETYSDKLAALGPTDIYVSDVIGSYVPSHFIGIYTPKQMAISAVNAEITALKALGDAASTTAPAAPTAESAADPAADPAALSQLVEELTALVGEDGRIAALEVEGETDEAYCKATNDAVCALLDETSEKLSSDALKARVEGLKERIAAITFNPEQEAYAGYENPNGARFKGIIRWIKPVYEGDTLLGYVSMALNHDFIMEYVDHVTPMEERYTDLPNAYNGNYAFIWDYQCRSIAHPRHHSIVGYDATTGFEDIPWLESSIYEGLLAQTGSADIEQFEAAWPSVLNDPQTRDESDSEALDLIKGVPVFDGQSRDKKPAAELTKTG
ncbi:MAG: hypothetical protein LBL27_03145, partial [Coriobacteriales bacterium]|nr:hypothetical protein [Coriobacteriales bacterium]